MLCWCTDVLVVNDIVPLFGRNYAMQSDTVHGRLSGRTINLREWRCQSGTGEVAVLDSLRKDHTFRGLWVFAVDKRVAIAFAETKGTETDDSGVGSDLEVPSVRRAKEEGEEGEDEVSRHGDDGRGSKVEGGDGRNARSGDRHEERCDDGLHCLGCEKRSDEVQTRRGDIVIYAPEATFFVQAVRGGYNVKDGNPEEASAAVFKDEIQIEHAIP